MAKFKVKVKVIAACEYEVEVEDANCCNSHAEIAAENLWPQKLPSDFRVASGYITEFETDSEQLTADCPSCFVEHRIGTADYASTAIVDGKLITRPDVEWWVEDNEYCAACGAKIEAEEKANG